MTSRHHRVNTWISARTRAEQTYISKLMRDLEAEEIERPSLALGSLTLRIKDPHPDEYLSVPRRSAGGSEMDMIE